MKERMATLKDEMSRLEGLKAHMEAAPDRQVSLTDPDARSMASQGKGTRVVGYNVQTAVETKNHLIVAHEVTNVGSDRHQLKRMSEQAREALGSTELTALADRGYYSGEEIGSTRRCWMTCSVASMRVRWRCRRDEARQSIRSGRSRPGWARPTSCVEAYRG
jgi:transposase